MRPTSGGWWYTYLLDLILYPATHTWPACLPCLQFPILYCARTFCTTAHATITPNFLSVCGSCLGLDVCPTVCTLLYLPAAASQTAPRLLDPTPHTPLLQPVPCGGFIPHALFIACPFLPSPSPCLVWLGDLYYYTHPHWCAPSHLTCVHTLPPAHSARMPACSVSWEEPGPHPLTPCLPFLQPPCLLHTATMTPHLPPSYTCHPATTAGIRTGLVACPMPHITHS